MKKKKIAKKRELTLDDIEGIEIDEARMKDFTPYDPGQVLSDHTAIAKSLLECLLDGDDESFKDILDGYLRVNGVSVPKAEMLASRKNPTLKTIAKIAHLAGIKFEA